MTVVIYLVGLMAVAFVAHDVMTCSKASFFALEVASLLSSVESYYFVADCLLLAVYYLVVVQAEELPVVELIVYYVAEVQLMVEEQPRVG